MVLREFGDWWWREVVMMLMHGWWVVRLALVRFGHPHSAVSGIWKLRRRALKLTGL